jgi:predicted  nucleic acid-binding Zn-ribbon protein
MSDAAVSNPSSEPRGLRDLLRIQEIDLALDRLNARRAVLVGGSEVAAARADASVADAALGQLRFSLDDIAREQARLEHDIDSMAQKRRDEEKRLYDGSVANARELQSIRAEVENIASRTSRTEDRLLEVMEDRERVEGETEEAAGRAATAREALESLTAGSAEEFDQVEASIAAQRKLRDANVPAIDPDLLELYDDMRRQKKGVGVAELKDGVCQGCHQKLSPMELDRLKRATGVRRCEYCRRILVIG